MSTKLQGTDTPAETNRCAGRRSPKRSHVCLPSGFGFSIGWHCDAGFIIFFFSSRRRHTSLSGDWSSDVCSSDLYPGKPAVRSEYFENGNPDQEFVLDSAG